MQTGRFSVRGQARRGGHFIRSGHMVKRIAIWLPYSPARASPGLHAPVKGACALRPREPRRKALVMGRMRQGASWHDVTILNVSLRGLLLQTGSPPGRGNYVEVRRGHHVIVARVIWVKDQRFGVRTQDRVSIEELIREPDRSAAEFRKVQEVARPVDRRTTHRNRHCPDERHERGRHVSRVAQFVCLTTFGALMATAASAAIGKALAHPLSILSDALTLN